MNANNFFVLFHLPIGEVKTKKTKSNISSNYYDTV